MLTFLIFITIFIRSVPAYEGKIQRFDALDDVVAIARAVYIHIYRPYNGTDIDLSVPLYKIPIAPRSFPWTFANILIHLKLVTTSQLSYCNSTDCWLCSLKDNGSHLCQEYHVSNSWRKMSSVECVVGDVYMTVRFIDAMGNGCVTKFEIAVNETQSPIYPKSKADDMEETYTRNNTLLKSFHSGRFSYFVESADRVDVPACLLSKKPTVCTKYKKIVRAIRVCDDDETEHLESKTTVTLRCSSTFWERKWDAAFIASYNKEYGGFLTIGFASSSTSTVWFCQFFLKDIEKRSQQTWDICQNVTYSSVQKCRAQDAAYRECRITSTNSTGQLSLCRKYSKKTSSKTDICSLRQYSSDRGRHYWLEDFGPVVGYPDISLDPYQAQLLSFVYHPSSDSYFVLKKTSDGSTRIDRMMGDQNGEFGDASNTRSLWNTSGVDTLPLVYDSLSNAIFYSRNNSVEIQPVTCRNLYKSCDQIPPKNERDPLNCAWCQVTENEGFSRPQDSHDPALSCPESKLFIKACPQSSTLIFNPLSKIAIGLGVTVAVLVLVAVVYFVCKARMKGKESPILNIEEPRSPLPQPSPFRQFYEAYGTTCSDAYRFLFERSDKRISYEDLTMDSVPIGEGCYGQVYRGEYRKDGTTITVACKMVTNPEESSTADFLREARAMWVLDHPRVLEFVGICFDSEQPNRPTILVTKYMSHGDLRGYLRNINNVMSFGQMLNFGLEVAEGMDYIHSMGIIHRDLAARNCMLDDDLHVCIADFGLSRFIADSDEVYQMQTSRMLPVTLMSIEALAHGHFSTKSDVWAFGNLLWEVMTRGCRPWEEVSCRMDLLRCLRQGERLPLQQEWPPSIYYRIMMPCWSESPDDRPTFRDILAELNLVIEDLGAQRRFKIDTGYEVVRT
ncbi:hypothetical protein QR680_010497 [Steinernema hermaphroditum]|uniref:receptor protein-tyrosine kinase n=1 Tax=Steinernema hermaphroditum TaxID=289476 RepID=A0AA39IP99_9BILA|nr:hypothetical protein QR680_010497 [Steinernema hermaphroditum]